MERGRFEFWRMIICPPFMFEWQVRELVTDWAHTVWALIIYGVRTASWGGLFAPTPVLGETRANLIWVRQTKHSTNLVPLGEPEFAAHLGAK